MISVCMIVKDEEEFLRGTLQCLQGLGAEVIVADTGSQDSTKEILKSENVQWFELPWEKSFAKARNATLEKATQSWILSLDADEKIAKKDIPQYLNLVKKLHQDKTIDAIQIVRRNYVQNVDVNGVTLCRGEYPDEEKNCVAYYEEPIVRLFRNRSHIRWDGANHESIFKSLLGRVDVSNLVLHHYGFTSEVLERKYKQEVFEDWGKDHSLENPISWKDQYDLGCSFLQSGQMEKAIACFKKADQLRPQFPMILSNLAYAEMETGKFMEAEYHLKLSIQVDSQHHDSLLNLGVLFMRVKRWGDATTFLSKLTHLHPESYSGFRNLGVCYAKAGLMEDAIVALERSVEIFPRFVDARADLALIHTTYKRFDQAKSLLEQSLELDPKNPRVRQILDWVEKQSGTRQQ